MSWGGGLRLLVRAGLLKGFAGADCGSVGWQGRLVGGDCVVVVASARLVIVADRVRGLMVGRGGMMEVYGES